MDFRILITLLTVVALIGLERLYPVVQTPRGRRLGHWPQNIFLVLLFQAMMFLFPALAPVAIASLSTEFELGLRFYFGPSLVREVSFFVMGLLALDLLVFLSHWSFHRISWLWPYHRVHHSETHLDATSAFRFHPMEFMISTFLKGIVIMTLGLSLICVLAFEVTLGVMALFTHSNIKLPHKVDRFLIKGIVTPNFHRVHHHKDSLTTNYGTIFSFWDRMFRTERVYDSGEVSSLEIGLNRPVPCERIDQLLVQPWYELPED